MAVITNPATGPLQGGPHQYMTPVDLTGNSIATGPTANAVQTANTAGNVVIKGLPGYLWTATVTVVGTAELDIFDNATTNAGNKLLAIPANAPVGSIYSFVGGGRASAGIVSAGVLNCPGVTFYFS